MVKVTVEVPEALVGDIYVAVGKVLQYGQEELDEAAKELTPHQRDGDDELADEA